VPIVILAVSAYMVPVSVVNDLVEDDRERSLYVQMGTKASMIKSVRTVFDSLPDISKPHLISTK